jgi:hypothetical protein
VDRASAITAEQVADLIRDQAWSQISLRLAEALKDESPDLAEPPGFRRESRRIPPRRRTRKSPHPGRAGAD